MFTLETRLAGGADSGILFVFNLVRVGVWFLFCFRLDSCSLCVPNFQLEINTDSIIRTVLYVHVLTRRCNYNVISVCGSNVTHKVSLLSTVLHVLRQTPVYGQLGSIQNVQIFRLLLKISVDRITLSDSEFLSSVT